MRRVAHVAPESRALAERSCAARNTSARNTELLISGLSLLAGVVFMDSRDVLVRIQGTCLAASGFGGLMRALRHSPLPPPSLAVPVGVACGESKGSRLEVGEGGRCSNESHDERGARKR